MKIIFTTLFFLYSVTTFAQTPGWAWAHEGGSNATDAGNCTATDSSGNVYAAGYFDGPTISFGGFQLNNTDVYTDIFIVKYSASGNVIWAQNIAGIGGPTTCEGIAVDKLGDIFITGKFSGQNITFGSFTLVKTMGSTSVFIAKLDSSGSFLWADNGNGPVGGQAKGIAIDSYGNACIYGWSSDMTFGGYNSTGPNFIVKYSSLGAVIWLNNFSGGSYNYGAESIACDQFGNIFISGAWTQLQFGSIIPPAGANIFLTKFDSSGAPVWVQVASMGVTLTGNCNSVSCDGTGNIIITGSFGSTLTFGSTNLINSSNGSSVFVVKYSNSGAVLWAKKEGGLNGTDSYSVTSDGLSNIYITGTFESLNMAFGTTILFNGGARNIFVAKYDSSGNILWAKSAVGNGTDYSFSISSDVNNNVYVTGYFTSSNIFFDSNTLVNLSGTQDVFVAKIGTNCSLQSTIQTTGNLIFCDGDSVTLSANTGTGYLYQWQLNGADIGGASNANYTTDSAGSYTVTVSTSSGCSATSATTLVVVNPLPIVNANPISICNGSNGTLIATGATTYTWSPSVGLSATTGTSVTANPILTSTYIVTGTNTSNCSDTASVVVTVNPLPTVTVNPITICNGLSGTLTATGANTYTWAPSAELSATTGSSVTASPTITSTYTVIGFNTSSCSDTVTVVVTVTTEPTLSVDSAIICFGLSATLTATGSTTYTWSPSTGLDPTTGAIVTVNPTSTTSYTVTGISACGTTTAIALVTVVPLPSLTVNPITICIGLSGTLSATGAATYTWTPSTGLSATIGSTVTANPTVTTTYTIVGSNSATCSDTATVVVTVNSVPIVNVNSISICNGSSGTLTATSSDTYSWSPTSELNASTGASVIASPTVTTSYTVTGISSCGTTTAVAVVTVLPSPTANAGDDVLLCGSDSVQLNATGGVQYSWSPTTGLSDATIENPFANPSVTTTYIIVVTDADGCTTSDEIKITRNGETCFFIPSVFTPNNDGTNDTWEVPGLNSYTSCSVKVFNRWGQLLFSSVGYAQPWDGTYVGNKLPIADYYYIIDLKNGTPAFTGTVTIKL